MENNLFQAPEIIENITSSPTFESLNKVISITEEIDIVKKWDECGFLVELDSVDKLELAKLFNHAAYYLLFISEMKVIPSATTPIDSFIFPVLRRIYRIIYINDSEVEPPIASDRIISAGQKLRLVGHQIDVSKLVAILMTAFADVENMTKTYRNTGIDIEAETCIIVSEQYVLESVDALDI